MRHRDSRSSSDSEGDEGDSVSNLSSFEQRCELGTRVTKDFDGTTCRGQVVSFDPEEDFCQIWYEDGDEEVHQEEHGVEVPARVVHDLVDVEVADVDVNDEVDVDVDLDVDGDGDGDTSTSKSSTSTLEPNES